MASTIASGTGLLRKPKKKSQQIIHAHARISCYNNPFRDRSVVAKFGSGTKTQFIVEAVYILYTYICACK